jgi:DNA-binding MarR family transcriptional regulator
MAVDGTLRSQTVKAWTKNRPDVDTSPMAIVALVNAVTAALDQAAAQVYEGSGVTSADMKLLVPLRYDSEPVTAARLAERLTMSRAGVSKTLTRLERRGIVERQPHPTDGRSALVRVTEHGTELIDRLFPRELEAHGQLLSAMASSRDRVVESLTILATALEAPGQHAVEFT